MSSPASIFTGEVMHRRLFPVQYRFSYRIFSLLVDIDLLDALPESSPFLSRNRFNLLGFYDRDHGPRDGTDLRAWIDRLLCESGIDERSSRVALLCMPRYLGYVFNPMSVWFCYRKSNDLHAIVCEVRNTFGESHCYLIHNRGEILQTPIRSTHKKQFHVSPFISMNAEYRFRFSEPTESLAIGIREFQNNECMLAAVQTGKRKPLTIRNVLQSVIFVPLMTFKVVLMIHWNALLIWIRGAKFYKKPPPPKTEVSV